MCEKCGDRGFTEEDHGLIVILCDCDKAREVAEQVGVPWREDVSGTERDNQSLGSTDTGKSKQPRKPKAKKKARARAS